ncbi:peptidase S8/S53 domain-containing protein [Hypomontagnella submonticulosa]|nr:peptidase S8/S53 domain-containing protein [Hypomontagnella submonticulosa]
MYLRGPFLAYLALGRGVVAQVSLSPVTVTSLKDTITSYIFLGPDGTPAPPFTPSPSSALDETEGPSPLLSKDTENQLLHLPNNPEELQSPPTGTMGSSPLSTPNNLDSQEKTNLPVDKAAPPSGINSPGRINPPDPPPVAGSSSGAQTQPNESGEATSFKPRDDASTIYEYIVFPKDRDDKNAVNASYSGILAIVTDPARIRTQESPYLGVIYWDVKLTMDQAKLVYQVPGVSSVSRECDDDCYDPSTELVRQPDSSDDIVMIGQFGALDEQSNLKKQDLGWYQHNYIYDDTGGRGVDVYIVDTGAKLDHAEFTNPQDDNIKTRARFIQAESGETEENDSAIHGTCMLSRVAGHKYGVAKSINPIIVRVPSPPKIKNYLNGVQRVIEDIGSGNKQAIVSLSWFYPRTDPLGRFIIHNDNGEDTSEDPRVALRGMLRLLGSKGVTVVTGSGNDGRAYIDGFPADFGDPNSGINYIPELMVVGGTSADGTQPYSKSNYDVAKGLPHVYAPAVDIQCANSGARVAGQIPEYRTASGTSQAAASVAGLAAYFIGLGNQRPLPEIDVSTPALLKDHIIKLAWPRGDNQNMISYYNGARPADAGVDGPSCRIVRRTSKESDLPNEEDCGCPAGQQEVPDEGNLANTPTTLQTSTMPTATAAPVARKWTCTPGLTLGNTCRCMPDCDIGVDGCVAKDLQVGEEGCDINCTACVPVND